MKYIFEQICAEVFYTQAIYILGLKNCNTVLQIDLSVNHLSTPSMKNAIKRTIFCIDSDEKREGELSDTPSSENINL
jgi:hypothetical protein